MIEVLCDYCKKPAQLVSGVKIYPHRTDLNDLKFWNCEQCKAYVGCHKNSKKNIPLGRLANSELRIWKQNAHSCFDPIWKSGKIDRPNAYAWLAKRMGIDKEFCHIGRFSVEQCKQVIKIVKESSEK